jgi:hypothetical protein
MIKWVDNVSITSCSYVDRHWGHNVIFIDSVSLWVITVLVQEGWIRVVTAGRRTVVEKVLCTVERQPQDVAE